MDEMVALRVNVIVASAHGAQDAASATDTIPIVANVDDPVEIGLTATLARPNRNVTGVTDSPGLSIHSKRLQLLKEVAPTAKRVAALDWKYVDSRTTPGTHARRREIETTAQQLGITLIAVGADSVDELDRALAVCVTEHADALLEMDNPVAFAGRRAIVEFALRNRLPAVYSSREFVDVGGLLSYGTSLPAVFGRMAEYVDKILRGAKIIDLPWEHPTTFELLVNMKTANALGLAMPQSMLLRASEVVR
jgi:putative ABC transport system substrate-binding protein